MLLIFFILKYIYNILLYIYFLVNFSHWLTIYLKNTIPTINAKVIIASLQLVSCWRSKWPAGYSGMFRITLAEGQRVLSDPKPTTSEFEAQVEISFFLFPLLQPVQLESGCLSWPSCTQRIRESRETWEPTHACHARRARHARRPAADFSAHQQEEDGNSRLSRGEKSSSTFAAIFNTRAAGMLAGGGGKGGRGVACSRRLLARCPLIIRDAASVITSQSLIDCDLKGA